MTSFRSEFGVSSVSIDERDHIGPHHLAIGKTRKLFERNGVVHAFFSRGYEIAHTRIRGGDLEPIDTQVLDLPAAWGGGAFCIDDDRRGGVSLVFLHRNQHELCIANGRVEDNAIRWSGWRTLLVSRARQAAPWLEVGPDGTAWASVLDRDGDIRLAVVHPGGHEKIGDLFAPGEAHWYHSCVQMLPVEAGLALAVGFRGAFPTHTELVFKTVSADLELGKATTLAPCNVNDRLTFHFQAVGDPAHACAHIVYLDDGLSVSHARYADGDWQVSRGVLPFVCFAPQICVDEAGAAALLAADYEGVLWSAAWSAREGWSGPRRVQGVPAPNVSPQFATTGYGTGGLIGAARSTNGRVPFLTGTIVDESSARARLHAAMLGHGDGLLLDRDAPLEVKVSGSTVEAEIRLEALRTEDLKSSGRCWLVGVPGEAGRALKLACTGGPEGPSARAFWLERDGTISYEKAFVRVEAQTHGAFSPSNVGAALRLIAELKDGASSLQPGQAWVETYAEGWSLSGSRDARLCDIGPFECETAAAMALHPERIKSTFKRMV